MQQPSIAELDFQCRIRNRNVRYNKLKWFCGFGDDEYNIAQ